MISYAQNREDALLARAFAHQVKGFYIDIGANHPTVDSVTRHFYDLGWSGINVEPGETYPELAAARPRDTNLNVAVSNRGGAATYFEFAGTGLSTLCEAEVAARLAEGRTPRRREVPALTLAALCAAHAPQLIDFISIDVEGHEREVIEGGDWQQWRPRIALIESTRPNSTEPAFAGWEPLLLAAGYLFAVSDGLNRVYVREEDAVLAAAVQRPLTVLDDVVPYRHVQQLGQLQDRIAELEQALCASRRSRSLRQWVARAMDKSWRWLAGSVPPAQTTPLAPTGAGQNS